MKDRLYEQQLVKLIQQKKKIAIFGYGSLGKIAMKTMNNLGIEVQVIIDNDTNKQGTYTEEIQIVSREQASQYKKELAVIVCIFDTEHEKEIQQSFYVEGWEDIIDKDFVIYHYLSKCIKPMGVSVQKPMNVISDKIVTKSALALIITEKCSLKCKYCSHYIPYRNNPIHYKAEDCINEVKGIAQLMDRIDVLSIYGGEALLHPDLLKICEAIQHIDNIYGVEILTNGTIEPSNDLFMLWSRNSKFKITISDYGEYSRQIQVIMKKCEQYSIPCNVRGTGQPWVKNKVAKKHNRSSESNLAIYSTCRQPEECPVIASGKFYKCVTSYISEKMGWMRDEQTNKDCFEIKVLEPNQVAARKLEFEQFLTSVEGLCACDYCHQGQQDEISRAEQIVDGHFGIDTLMEEE